MDPFNLKIVAPTRDTTTGWEDRLSGSGGVIKIVRTDPKLVPTHRVGVSVVGSRNYIDLEKHLRFSPLPPKIKDSHLVNHHVVM